VKRYSLSTPGGNRLRLDDEHNVLRLEDASGGSVEMADHRITLRDASGNEVELTRERVRIHSEADLVIEAPGHDVRIVGRAVDFETG
jgi:hypothetical protein